MTTAADTPVSPPSKASLASWWEKFKRNGKEKEKEVSGGIFGVPLQKSINYANVAISLTDSEGKQFIYGYIPVVVAKCGVFLKDKATDIEGIFRLSGSAKRIKELQTIFDSPDKYGKGLDWTGYTVHDAANVLRRYLNQLPEPIIPLNYYHKFRAPLTVPTEEFNVDESIKMYQRMISELPPLNRQLLLYVLDLLAVFASKSDQNLMTAGNLASIFQPGLISHPEHEMAPEEYRISQEVLVFLITHQDNFLLGMRGNNDGDILNTPDNGRTPTTPSSLRHSKTLVARTPSTGSAGAEAIRKAGGVRRNVSVSSRKSSSPAASGVHRSNTLPPKKSPRGLPNTYDGASSPKPSGPGNSGAAPAVATSSSEARRSPAGSASGSGTAKNLSQQPSGMRSPLAGSRKVSPSLAPPAKLEGGPSPAHPNPPSSRDRNITSLFSLSPEGVGREPRKLRKKRSPGMNRSAESSTTSLAGVLSGDAQSVSNPTLDPVPGSPPAASQAQSNIIAPRPIAAQSADRTASNSLMPAMSPTPSATSSVTSQESSHSYSDATNNSSISPEKKQKARSRWRLSNPKVDNWNPPTSPTFGGSNGSLVDKLRRASRSPPVDKPSGSLDGSGDEEARHRGAFGWLTKRRSGRTSSQTSDNDLMSPKLGPVQPPTPSAPNPPGLGSPKVQPPTPKTDLPESVPEAPLLEEKLAEPVVERERDNPTPRQSMAIPKGGVKSMLSPDSPPLTHSSQSDDTIIPLKRDENTDKESPKEVSKESAKEKEAEKTPATEATFSPFSSPGSNIFTPPSSTDASPKNAPEKMIPSSSAPPQEPAPAIATPSPAPPLPSDEKKEPAPPAVSAPQP